MNKNIIKFLSNVYKYYFLYASKIWETNKIIKKYNFQITHFETRRFPDTIFFSNQIRYNLYYFIHAEDVSHETSDPQIDAWYITIVIF